MKFRHIKKHIPSAFTLMNLLSGFSAIIIADLRVSSFLLILGMVFDVFDGMFARLFEASSEIGKELDSLADLVSFGVAPAFLYSLMRPGDHWSFFIPSFILLIGAAYRLAIFNSLPPSRFFKGLATPACALFMIGVFLAYTNDSNVYDNILSNPFVYAFIPMFLSLLMLSDIQMFSFKNIGLSKNFNIFIIGGVAFFIILLVINVELAIIIGVLLYIGLSMIYTLILRNKKRQESVNK